MARFSVCIPVRNGAAFLESALQSIESQTLKDVRVVVSDNASTDGTPEILARWTTRLDMQVEHLAETLPMRENFNRLLGRIDTEFYMILCHDDYLAAPDALASAQAALDANPKLSAVYCDLRYVSEHGKPLATRRFGRQGEFNGDTAGRRSVRTGRNCFGIPLAVRRSALGDLRYADEFLYAMDLDLSWSISRAGPNWHIPAPLIANRYGRHNSTWSMHETARDEYIRLAEKHGLPMGSLDRLRIEAVCFQVARQKQIFGLYERMTSWTG